MREGILGTLFGDMGSFGLYLAFLMPLLILGFVIQGWLKKTVSTRMRVPLSNGLSGEQLVCEALIFLGNNRN